MIKISLKEMFEAGVHFGHQTRRWNPKMRDAIYTQRRGIHIIDLQKTAPQLQKALQKVYQVAAGGDEIVFVCTKNGVNDIVAKFSEECNMPYIKRRWLGGFLTNWNTVSSRIHHLNKLEAEREAGDHERYTKKEQIMIGRKVDRLNMFLGGVKDMKDKPGALIVFDVTRDKIAIDEAKKIGIPVIGLVDTNADPDTVDFPIAANDDAQKSIEYMANMFSQTIASARKEVKKPAAKNSAPKKKDSIEVSDKDLAEKGDK